MSLLLSFALLAAQAASAPPSQAQTAAPPPAAAKTADDRVDRAFTLMREGKQAEAIAILDTKIADFEKGHPANSATMVFSASNMAQTIYYAGLSAAAKKNGVVLDGDWALAYFLKGFALIDLNRSDDAFANLEKAVALSPSDAQYLAERGEWYKSRKQWDKAFTDFKAAVFASSFSDDSMKAKHKSRGLRGMGFVRIEQGDWNEAEKLFKQSLEVEPGNANALSELEFIKSHKPK